MIDLLKGTNEIYNFAEFVFIGEKISERVHRLQLENLTFEKKVVFDGAIFHDQFKLQNVVFEKTVDFRHLNAKATFWINDCSFLQFCDFSKSTFKKIIRIEESNFKSPMMFTNAHCHDTLQINRVTFNHMAGFTSTIIEADYESYKNTHPVIAFRNLVLNDCLDFTNTQFLCALIFDSLQINDKIDFLNTVFNAKKPTTDIKSATLHFNNLMIEETGVMDFRSTDPKNKLFKNDVSFNFNGEVKGLINFEYVNFSYIYQPVREKLRELEKLNRVNIGKGCLKYRFQTDIKEVSVREGNQALITEFLEAFTSYFSLNTNTNLGVEIVGRTEEVIQFFYFTDQENITEEGFEEALRKLQTTDWIHKSTTNELGKYLVNNSTSKSKEEAEKMIDKSFLLSKLKNIATTIGLKIKYGLGVIDDIKNIANVYPNPTAVQHTYIINGVEKLVLNSFKNSPIHAGRDLQIGDNHTNSQTVNNQGATIERQTNIGKN